ncbi:MAG TPA: methylamine dehydrogenase accessory protein MauD [Candidatus Binatia bacterium]|jgi:methylamine dehydrogenase accessory protein MauD|nr:methylamine dehydrogenase accessory protein MauD [Candidatus Binatia bacterium]
MMQALVISTVVLWITVVVLAGVVVALTRQIGVLYERVAPAGALAMGNGPVVGEAAPVVPIDDLTGRRHDLGSPRADGRSTLLFFLSPTCPVCKTLLPALRSAARSEAAWLDVVLASDGPRPEHEAFVATERLDGFPYVLSPMLGMTWQVGRLPYAALIDGGGIVRARGLVNTREHLESLFEAKERGVASIQDWANGDGNRTEVA